MLDRDVRVKNDNMSIMRLGNPSRLRALGGLHRKPYVHKGLRPPTPSERVKVIGKLGGWKISNLPTENGKISVIKLLSKKLRHDLTNVREVV